MAFVESPHTDPVGATFVGNGTGIDDLSMEMSFHSPKKRRNEIFSQSRNKSHNYLKTVGSRNNLAQRPNFAGNRGSGEFTPLLKSVTKKAVLHGKQTALVPQTPAFLRNDYAPRDSPDLMPPDSSELLNSDTESDLGVRAEQYPLSNVASSSTQCTPVAVLPLASGDRILDEQRNLMTLREQENACLLSILLDRS